MKTSIVFFGTPEFARESLSRLYDDPKVNIKGVVSAPDRESGRGLQRKQSEVAAFAAEHNIPLSQPLDLENDDFIKVLKVWNAEVFVVVAFRKLPKNVWSIPKSGTFNIHASLLPAYRGAAPIQWVIANGELSTGVTSFFINDVIDSGDVILQLKVKIGENESVSSLYNRLKIAGASLALDTIFTISGEKSIRIEQKTEGIEKKAPKIFSEFSHLELLNNLNDIHNRIRACDAFPGASIPMINGNNGRIKLFKSEVINNYESKFYSDHVKLIISDKEIIITQVDRALKIGAVQWPGKRRMDTFEFVKGFRERGVFEINGKKIA